MITNLRNTTPKIIHAVKSINQNTRLEKVKKGKKKSIMKKADRASRINSLKIKKNSNFQQKGK